jgi:transketolase
MERGRLAHERWTDELARWREIQPEHAAELDRMRARDVRRALPALAELRGAPRAVATRVASGSVLDAVAPDLPEVWGGSADLAESNGTGLKDIESYLPRDLESSAWPGLPGGQLVHFGIREHAMGAILNGIALGGVSRPFGATFFVFADYMRPSVRLAALMRLPVTYVWSHDSIAVGEDGPTHQPLEQLWSYRAIIGLAVARPADWVETVDVWERILTRPSGPVAITLGRQNAPVVAAHTSPETGAARGAYVIREPSVVPDALVIATGSEVAVALAAATTLSERGIEVRVVSAPCLEWFEQETAEYRDSVLPPNLTARVSVEAGTDTGWYKWIGTRGRAVAVRDYGSSGAGDELLARAGITEDSVVSAVEEVLQVC